MRSEQSTMLGESGLPSVRATGSAMTSNCVRGRLRMTPSSSNPCGSKMPKNFDMKAMRTRRFGCRTASCSAAKDGPLAASGGRRYSKSLMCVRYASMMASCKGRSFTPW